MPIAGENGKETPGFVNAGHPPDHRPDPSLLPAVACVSLRARLHDPGALCLPQPLIFGAWLRPARQSGDALHIISALRDPDPCDQARSVGHARLNGRALLRIAVEAKREPAVGRKHHLPPVERHRYGVGRRLPDRIAALGERPLKGKGVVVHPLQRTDRSEEHTSELQSLMRISYAVFCLKTKTPSKTTTQQINRTNT